MAVNMENVLPRGAVRDVDKLLSITDGKLAQQDMEYLEKHHLNKLFTELFTNLLTMKPLDPVQYIIDSVQFSSDFAQQDPKTGLPEYRRAKLADVFKVMDKSGSGTISFSGLQQYTSKYGGEVLGDQELKSIFRDFKSQGGNVINLDEFLTFFAKVSRTIPNMQFDQLVSDLLA